ncbi:MAG: hypothetical protein JSS57_14575 [Proteobacteria bacterium]|nr:hypothetical protein [Pseudomonadota bacterium]
MIEDNPSFGYLTVAHRWGENKNTVQRVLQLYGGQVRKRPVGFQRGLRRCAPTSQPNERCVADLCRVWAGRDGWTTLALLIDGYSRELLGACFAQRQIAYR